MQVDRRILLAGLLAAPLLACAAGASPSGTVRGTITGVVGTYIHIAARDGRTVTVALANEAPISVAVPARLADIRQGSYIGTAALPQPDGTLRALEVHLFPDSLVGVGQGHYPWDLQPGSTMTSGLVGTVQGDADRRITVVYRGGQQTVVVPPDAPVVAYHDGSPTLLVAGAHVVVATAPATDGMLRAERVVVGADGAMPPM